MNDWQLKGHGIEVSNLDQKPALPDLIVVNDRKGSFTQLAPLLHSGSLPAGAPLGQMWLTIPDLALKAPASTGANYLPTIRLSDLSEDGRPNFSGWIEGMPQRFGEPYTEDEFVTVLRDLGLTPNQVWGLTKTDQEWSEMLDTALTATRRGDLRHGTTPAYVRGCVCSECREYQRIRMGRNR